MILKLILQAIAGATISIFQMINSLIPNTNLIFSDLMTIISTILGVATQALNFVHFIVGDSLIFILAIIPPLLITKYLVLPIVDILRRLIPFVNL